MYKQDNNFANYDGSRMTLISSLRRQVLAIRTPLLCGLLVAAVLALLPIPATAQCAKWDASGYLRIWQRGSSRVNRITLEQKGRVLTGTASFVEAGNNDVVNGTVDGTIDGDSFSIQIFWSNRQIGVYNGKVLPSGRLDGEAYEKSSPQSRTIWHSEEVLKCAPPPAVIPRPLRSTGKAKPAPTPAPPPTPPFILAGPPHVIYPNAPFASVSLGWDGGPDHPNVEVRLSIDNGPETPAFTMDFPPEHPLFKQPKAGGEMKLQRQRLYKFVLKGAGKTLSTVVFVVP